MIRAAVLTVSDSAASGTRRDESGPMVAAHLRSQGWEVQDQRVISDEVPAIVDVLRTWTAREIPLIVTTGGTGVALRDVTPEATRQVLEREIPGLAELMRMRGLEKTPFAVLSRALAGTCGRSLVLNLPGSPKAAVESLQAVQHLIPHILELLAGHTEHEDEKLRRASGKP